ncbi:MAG: DUF2243 domain-containing protein [Mesorhizobium sp.]|nr:MAG: DUF2243 domain-containing protein [Mesorhizobium sp.]
MATTASQHRRFPTSAGILLGLGLGGFFDGIVLHQLLQWHHMATSAGYPADSVENLRFNTLLDGLFHAGTYVFVVLGLIVLWRTAHKSHLWWSGKMLLGTMLMGFGIFNLVEGVIDHQLLGIHHVNETVPQDQWIYWDIGFLIWGALMLIGGWALSRRGKRESPGEPSYRLSQTALRHPRKDHFIPLSTPGFTETGPILCFGQHSRFFRTYENARQMLLTSHSK